MAEESEEYFLTTPGPAIQWTTDDVLISFWFPQMKRVIARTGKKNFFIIIFYSNILFIVKSEFNSSTPYN